MPDLPDMDAVARDIVAQHDRSGLLVVGLTPGEAFAIIGQLQLAIRHPDNAGRTAEIATEFVTKLAKGLPESAQQIIAAGWNPENDA